MIYATHENRQMYADSGCCITQKAQSGVNFFYGHRLRYYVKRRTFNVALLSLKKLRSWTFIMFMMVVCIQLV